MPFNLGDTCFYTYTLESMVDTFGPVGAARVTWVSGDNSTYSVVACPFVWFVPMTSTLTDSRQGWIFCMGLPPCTKRWPAG